jgi:hypothetical protein
MRCLSFCRLPIQLNGENAGLRKFQSILANCQNISISKSYSLCGIQVVTKWQTPHNFTNFSLAKKERKWRDDWLKYWLFSPRTQFKVSFFRPLCCLWRSSAFGHWQLYLDCQTHCKNLDQPVANMQNRTYTGSPMTWIYKSLQHDKS